MTKPFNLLWKHFLEDNLFRNSIYLMLTTGTMGGFGFFFWLVCTHIFTPSQIGVSTTLISAMTLISFVSLFGFNSTFVRFLPSSQNRNKEINTGSIIVMGAAALISIAYIILIPYITPSLGIIRENVWYSIGFVIMVTFAAANSLSDSIFIAYRAAQYNFLTDGIIISVAKLLLPFVFIGVGAYGIFAASGLAVSIGMLVSFTLLYIKFGYRPEIRIDKEILQKVLHYSFTNYLANLFSIVPTSILPIIIIGRLGADAAGYFYLAFMIINLLYTVSASVSQSLFAEGSYSEKSIRDLIKGSLKIMVFLMLPAGLILAFFGPDILRFFGKSYSSGGSEVIALLALAAPAVAAFNIGSVLLRIRHQMYALVITNVVYAGVVAFLAVFWANKGLSWIAIAWLVGNLVAAIIAFVYIFLYRNRPTPGLPVNS
ncbi:MAG: polysaccharide biosynthesis protein [Candidatus Parcubacteria bacterium]|nr:polysaccharide biosynthesis protein [Candidatus Parcubacteria bacterium]